MGYGASVTSGSPGGIQGVAVGYTASANTYGVAVGGRANASGGYFVTSVGNYAGNGATGVGSFNLGFASRANYNGSICIGLASADTAQGQLVVGGDTGIGFKSDITDAYIGKGVVNTAPSSLLTINATGGSGTDVDGQSIALAGGKGTGSGDGGDLTLKVALPGSTGSSLNSLSDIMSISGNDGSVQFENYDIGFYGVTPTSRQVLATGAGASVDDVISALQTLGLVSQS